METDVVRSESSNASYGGRRIHIKCPGCGHLQPLIDSQFILYGPIRCGACGTELQSSIAHRIAREALLARTTRGH